MDNVRIQQNQSERIEGYFTNTAGAALSGLTPNLTVRRQSDGRFWTGGQDFTSAFTQVFMSAVNAVSIGGLYERTIDTTGLADDNYTLIASGTGAGNNPLTGELKVGGYVDFIDSFISKMSTAGGSLIHLDGVFSEEEKKRLFKLIEDSFLDLIEKISRQIEILSGMKVKIEKMGSIQDFKEISKTLLVLNSQTSEIQKRIQELNELSQNNIADNRSDSELKNLMVEV